MTIDSKTLYWLFSTIPQVLAAFIALSGVFLVFKIQELKKMQFFQNQLFINYLSGVRNLQLSSFHGCKNIAVRLNNLHQSGCIGGIIDEMDSILNNPNVYSAPEYESLNRMRNIFYNVNKKRKRLLRLAEISIISGVIAILISLIILITIHKINLITSIILYSIVFLGTLLSIGTMTITIFKSFSTKENKLIIKKK